MESLSKVLELAAKYAWAVLVMTAFVLFVPDDAAKQLGIVAIKTAYKGYFWLVLVFTGALLIGTLFQKYRKLIWRFIFCPLKKLAFPVKDLRTGIKQSRMRYYLVQFSFRSGAKPTAYQEVDSNGNVKGYADTDGKRFLPEHLHECSIIGEQKFQFPEWGRMDWSDIFNGYSNSGCWGISEK
jgi:hypothetical protein